MLRVLKRLSKLPISQLGWRSASSFKYLDLENTEDGYSVLSMHRKPVNSLNLEYLNELIEAVDSVEKTPESRGLVVTSSLKVFSEGLDLMELYNPERDESRRERLQTFWTAFQELNLRLHQSPLVTIAAINGAAPAGGCVLSLNCDYRIMAEGESVIGLNETHLSITASYWLCKMFASVVGQRQAEKHLCLGSLLSPQEALSVGVIDAVVPAEELVSTVDAEMKKWLSIPEIGRSRTKALLRQEYINDFNQQRQVDLEMFTEVVNDPVFQEQLPSQFFTFRDLSQIPFISKYIKNRRYLYEELNNRLKQKLNNLAK